MKLGEFKKKIESLPVDAEFSHLISEPFSWRGSYNEVAFAIERRPSTTTQILDRINAAYTREFLGYKGGTYTYDDYTEVHFEEDSSRHTDGEYVEHWISELMGQSPANSPEERLVNIIFR